MTTKKIEPLAPPALSYPEWQDTMERRYDRMPTWWWDHSNRREAYNNYVESVSHGHDRYTLADGYN